MKKSILTLMLMVAMLPLMANVYEQLADGVYQDGSTLYIGSGVTSLGNLQVNPTTIYCYATIPPACSASTFTGYGAALHVPTSAMVNYFSAQYWQNFANLTADAIEPESLTLNKSSVDIVIGQQFNLNATVLPANATPNTVIWSSSDMEIAIVNGGIISTVAPGECDIFARCASKQAVCHVTVLTERVTITLDKHEAKVLPNHMLTLAATCSPMPTDLTVMSSDNTIAMPRLLKGSIQVLGLKEGTATITVGSVDGTANTDACIVTVYTEVGDVNSDGYVNISDVTMLIDFLLSDDPEGVNTDKADTNRDGKVSISDVTMLIDYLLGGIDLNPPRVETFTVNGISFNMVEVQGGTFLMGATAEQGSDIYGLGTHQVTLSSYHIGETEVTQALWQAVMGNNPSYFTGNNGYTDNLQRPVEMISWYDCQEFISKLNEITGKNFRLPTEAEWEFAARGGTRSKGYKYAGSNTLDNVAWYYDNSYIVGTSNPNFGTHEVATKYPNELGIYDMSGNVWEWCQDWFDSYNSDAQTNPTGPASGSDRVIRSGSWRYNGEYCCVSFRVYCYPSLAYNTQGLRIAL